MTKHSFTQGANVLFGTWEGEISLLISFSLVSASTI
jgi:hypothetical protein